MDDPAPSDFAQVWERLTTTMRPSIARILAHAQEIRHWAMQAEQLSEQERARVLAHLTELEAMASRLETLTVPASNLRDE